MMTVSTRLLVCQSIILRYIGAVRHSTYRLDVYVLGLGVWVGYAYTVIVTSISVASAGGFFVTDARCF